ncbi:MAG: hypothetical protein ACI9FJ_000770 [Alteromonadaceae bacterium]|jgi:hypothetical protein
MTQHLLKRTPALLLALAVTTVTFFAANAMADNGELALTNGSKSHVLQSFKIYYEGKWRRTEIRSKPSVRFLKPNEKMVINFKCQPGESVRFKAGFTKSRKPAKELEVREGKTDLCERNGFTIRL